MSNAPETQLSYRSNAGLCVAAGPPSNALLHQNDQVKMFRYSNLGKYIAVQDSSSLTVYTSQMEEVRPFTLENILEFDFSSLDTYLVVFTRFIKPGETEQPKPNLFVLDIQSGQVVLQFVQKNQKNWNIQWTSDEALCARLLTNEIQCFEPSKNARAPAFKISVENVDSFSISPGKRHILAAFIPEKKGSPACIKLFDMLNAATPLSQKSFFRADSVSYHWNAIGTNILIFTHTDVDATGKSYYGETNLYYLSITGNFDGKVELDKAGPIHDVAWSPNSKEFIVVYGTMPAKATLFDHRATPIYELGSAARNQVRFNNTGRLFFLAGFGNLAGDLVLYLMQDVWDRKGFNKVITMQASNSSSCEWCPDGKHFMTSTLYKRLKVDNGIKIFHYTGVLVHQVDVKEMYQAEWRPDSADLWPEKASLSPPPAGIKAATPTKSVGKYRPPAARAAGVSVPVFVNQLTQDRDALIRAGVNGYKQGIPGLPDHPKKKKGPKVQPVDANKTVVGVVPGGSLELEKKLKNLSKKLKQITDLKEKQLAGQPLELTQIQKIESEERILDELAELQQKLGLH